MTSVTPPPRPHRLAKRDEDVLARLNELIERQQMTDLVVKGLAEDVSSVRQDVRSLREKDTDNERSIQKLADSVAEQTKQFTLALRQETDAREKSQRSFTEALDASQKASLEALQKALLVSLAQKLGNWVLTMIVGALFIGASYIWTRH